MRQLLSPYVVAVVLGLGLFAAGLAYYGTSLIAG
jgi:hypothetical protein